MGGPGGKRPGAGRPRGSRNKKTTRVADEASARGITPLEVILACMWRAWEAKDYALAASLAKDAAPYMHARKAAVEHSGEVVSRVVEDENWYGNDAHHHAAEGPAAPNTRAA